ncbi:ABC transporter permease [Clostridium tetani]|uniref:ABC transporter-associated permease n=2 Tax=Clostridium tetani TaxID=1513 RepID=Q899Z8_CLOTE|nr:ABC transporter permease [Clostridium tetani]AAO37412.1 ABC transporter-associated permease [Clostridium tetani E88]KGI36666.1 hypothetical protein KY52_13175 [Clostridium tetani]RXI61501.1 ABC transporter permease [Clostridium tetani]RXI64942.1 ABC transporter permease [Clostridium tetani]RXI67279.1 ABC transporter permease [Clostridium tetani]
MSNLKLIIKYMKNKPKRTLSIIFSIIITSILLTIVGLVNYNIQINTIDNGKKLYGDYYADLNTKNKQKTETLKGYKYLKDKTVHIPYGMFTSKDMKTSLNIEISDETFLKSTGLEMLKGRFPKNKDEICVDESFLENMNITKKLDQYITLDLINSPKNLKSDGYKEYKFTKKFKLVGILKTNPGIKFKGVSCGILSIKNIDDIPKDFIDYHILIKTFPYKSVEEITKSIEHIQNRFNINEDDIFINRGLMQVIKHSNDSKILSIAFEMVVIIASILTIYNIFNMSILDRTKDYGILRCLGFRKKKIMSIVLKEGLILSIISIPIGILIGCFLSKSIYFSIGKILNNTVKSLTLSIYVILLVFIITLLSVSISAFMPAIYAYNVSPIGAIKNLNVYSKIHKIKHRKGHFIIKKLFKNEGMLAYKNIWRMKKRTYLIVFSLGISITIFTAFMYYFNHIAIEDPSENFKNGQFKLTFDNRLDNTYCYDNNFISKINNMHGIKHITKIQSATETAVLNESFIKSNLKDNPSENNLTIDNGEYRVPCNVIGYNEEIVKDLKTKIGKDEVILINDKYAKNNTNLKAGDIITLRRFYKDNIEQRVKYEDKEFKIKDILNKAPYQSSMIGISALIRHDDFKNFTKINGYRTLDISVYENFNMDFINNELENLTKEVKYSKLLSYYKEIKYIKDSIKFIKILTYSFIACIVLIGLLNIINTINTNIVLRMSEFATLKAIGFNKNHIRKVIMFEGLFYGILSSIFGMFTSGVVCILLYNLIPNMKPGFSIIIFCIPELFIIIISLLSSIVPLRKVNKINVINTLNEL